MAVRCLIVDDEPPAQRILERYIDDISYLELVGKATHPSEALNVLQSQEVDLVFLDINLPQVSGLDFLKSVDRLPEIIITTAYPEYALEGFELNVRDYLVKPISFDRFMKAISRLPTNTDTKESASRQSSDREPANKRTDFTFIKTDGAIYRIDFDKIRYLSSDGDYLNVYMDDHHYYLRQTLKYWHELLPEDQFFRVHKSYIVNLSRVNEIVGNRIKIGEEVVPIGRNYKADFFDKIDELM